MVFFQCKEGEIKSKSRSFYLKEGYYVYVGSCGKSCSKRISRHLNIIKEKKHWHVDYLSSLCEPVAVLVLPYSEKDLVKRLPFDGIQGFGNTDDKGSRTHLFYANLSDVIKLLRDKKL